VTTIDLTGLTVEQDGTRLLGPIDLHVEAGERLVVLGASGSGKTTLLRAIAGVQPLVDGRVALGGDDVTDRAPGERNLAMIDQEASLLPHLDVRGNLGFGLRVRHIPRAEVDERVAAQTRAFSLRSLLPRRPRTLSGGERHEVALARSLVRRSSALLMDEPLARIDAPRRATLLRELVRMQEGYGITLVVATNDQRVGMVLAHRIAVLADGRIAQVAPPHVLYERPANLAVAGLVGSPPMNLLDGTIVQRDGRLAIEASPLSIPTWASEVAGAAGSPVVVGVRPHQVRVQVVGGTRAPRASASGRVFHRGFAGAEVTLELVAPDGRTVVAVVPPPGPNEGTSVQLGVAPGAVHLFDPVSGEAVAHGI
jgi:multiple sugar transport system ATP-binding protein